MLKKTDNEKFLNLYNKLYGKKVLIIDLETTGLIKDKKQYLNYTDNNLYDTCRIIEIGYYYSDNFGNDNDNIKIYNFLRKTDENLIISETAQKIHNISIDEINNNGYYFSDILKIDLYKILNETNYIVSHNINFDFYVLLNELFRLKQFRTINRLVSLSKCYNVKCTCMLTGYKKLNLLYKNKFGIEINNAHRAGSDVIALLELICGKSITQINTINTLPFH